MICEKVHKPSSLTHCVQILSARDTIFSMLFSEVLTNDEGARTETRLINWFGKNWVCCVIDGITRFYAFFFFFLFFHNKQCYCKRFAPFCTCHLVVLVRDCCDACFLVFTSWISGYIRDFLLPSNCDCSTGCVMTSCPYNLE